MNPISNPASNPASFYQAGQFQRVCAVCGAGGGFHVHHVVPKQELKRRGLVHRLYDPTNALRLCEGLDTKRCHMQFEKRQLVIPTADLLDESICFIWEALGVAGQNFLERFHTGVDRRYTRHGEGACELCQLQPSSTSR